MDYYNSRYQDQQNAEEQEEDDTISLADFPTAPDHQDHSSPPEKIDVFEFSSHPNSTMCHAEDIINCGKLILFKEQDQSPSFNPPQSKKSPVMHVDHASESLYNRRRRSESLAELKISACRSNSTNSMRGINMRNSRSLDYQKLSRNSSLSSDSPDYRNNSRGSSRFDASAVKMPKPRWYIFMFGSVKFPPEINLQDIKNRQLHRTTSKSLFPNFEVVKKPPASRKRSWGVLKVLSCRDDASVNVTASLACVPRV